MEEQKQSGYQWVITLVVAVTAFGINFIHFQVAGLAPLIFAATQATPVQFGLMMGLPLLAASSLGIPFGALGDRYGVKLMVTIGLVVSLIGAAGRCMIVPNMGQYFFFMFLIGVSNAALNANFIKVLGSWLPPQKVGLGVGCYLAGIGLGQSSAIAVGGRAETLGPSFQLSIWVTAIILVVWLIFLKGAPAGAKKMPPQPVIGNLKYVMSKPAIWVGGVSILLMLGAYVTLNGFLVDSLIQIKGVVPKTAGMAGSVVAFSLMIGSLIAAALCKIVGRSKVFLLASGAISGVSAYLAWSLPYGTLTIVLLFGVGFFSGAFLSIILAVPMLLDYIGPAYAGSAGGVLSTLQSGGGFALPFLLPMIAGGQPNGIFNLIAGSFILMAIISLALPELMAKKS
ncbi:MAG: MFS transporter [Deltaproteobacteria bacterium]|jgi:NNP family nitrate/nitrite transporter-like MFS transporter|nr:MFS transporter [Deltaproteobacteria bacterium]